MTDIVTEMIPETTKKRKTYWWTWTEEIGELRKRCWAARRSYHRAGTGPQEARETARDLFLEARRTYKAAIQKSKGLCWDTLCDDLNSDIWGKAYKIVMKRMGKKIPKMPEVLVRDIMETVFPQGRYERKEYVEEGNIPHITLREVERAVKSLGKRKSPGPDLVPAEYVKVIFDVDPERLRRLLNHMLIWEDIPSCWKLARLVLLKKE